MRMLAAVSASLLVAFLLTTMPLPSWADPWRPAWVALTILYWCLAIPERVGVIVAWLVGLLLDVLHGALLGQHAFGLAFVAYLGVLYHQQIRVFPLVQQALVVGSIVFLYLAAMLAVYNLLGSRAYGANHLLGALTSALLWPWVFVILRDLRRKATA